MLISADMPDPAARPSRWKASLAWGIPPILAVVAHVNTLRNPFVFDDYATVVTNLAIRHLGHPLGVIRSGGFRPLETLSFAVDHAIWGLNPLGFHLTNLLLHALNTVLVFTLARAVDLDARRPGVSKPAPGFPATTLPLVAAALFAVHPLLTEAAGYVSARGDLLAALFVMLALLFLRKAVLKRQWGWTALSIGCFGLGLASKEIAIMFPFVALAYDRLLLRPIGEARERLLRFHLPLLAMAVLAGAARTASFLWIENPTSRGGVRRMGIYLLVQFEVVWQYVMLFVAPVSLSIFHDVGLSPRRSALGAAALLIVLMVVFLGRHRAPVAAVGVAWFLLLLVPSSSVIPLQHAMAEHRVYAGSVGMFLVLGWAVTRLLAATQWSVKLHALCHGFLVVTVGALLVLTVARNNVWADEVALWRDAVRKTPGWQTHLAFGDALREQQRCDEAVIAYREALVRAPYRLTLHDRLHACLVAQGRFVEAREVEQVLRAMDPDFTGRCAEIRELSRKRVSMDECVAAFRRGAGRPSKSATGT